MVVLHIDQVPDNKTEPRDVVEKEPEPASLANNFIDSNEDNAEMIKHLEELKLKLSELELKLCQVSLPYKYCSIIMKWKNCPKTSFYC